MKTETFETNVSITDPVELIDTFFKTYRDQYVDGDQKKIRQEK